MGVSEQILNYGAFFDIKKIRKNSARIQELVLLKESEFKRAGSFLSAVKALDSDRLKIISGSLDRDKIKRSASRTVSRELCGIYYENAGKGREKRRFLSSLCHEGVDLLYGTIPATASKTIVLRDSHGLPASVYLGEIRAACLEKGINIITCCCPTRPSEKLEHIILPGPGICFFTANEYHNPPENVYKTINTDRFCDPNALAAKKNLSAFLKKARNELLREAVRHYKSARAYHVELEEYYRDTVDFDGIHGLEDSVAGDILNRTP
ncbi:MAG: hypothetical protein FWF08_02020 [Oscillospiraceae bacterium]|nr:hypothetical protein [Oscillospiraceae bacterium]